MIQKIKDFIFGKVIIKKVAGKFAKHIVTALAGFFAAKPIIADSGINIDFTKFETWLGVVLAGLAGSAWNFIEHRFIKK